MSRRLRAFSGLLALGLTLAAASACGPSVRPDDPVGEGGWIVVALPPAAGPVVLRLDDREDGVLEPGTERRLGPLPAGAYHVSVRPIEGRAWRGWTVRVTNGGTTEVVVPVSAARPAERYDPHAAPRPAPAAPNVDAPVAEPVVDPVVDPVVEPVADEPTPTPKRRPTRRPQPAPVDAPRPPVEAPPTFEPPAPVEAPPTYAPPPPVEDEPPPPPGKGWLVVENRTGERVTVRRDGDSVGTVAAEGAARFAVPVGKARFVAEGAGGGVVATRTWTVERRVVWRLNPRDARIVVENSSGEAFSVQIAAEGPRRLPPGERWELETWAGLVPVRVVGEVSGRRLEARLTAKHGARVVWRTPVVRGAVGVRNGLGAPLRLTIDGTARGTVEPGKLVWTDGLPVGDHEVRIVSPGALRDERRTLRVIPGRKTVWEVP